MRNFPITIMDNFFVNPDKVRNFALHQEYFGSENYGNFSGKRTKHISELDIDFHNEFIKKFFSIYYDYEFEQLTWEVEAYFQITSGERECGWVHTDNIGESQSIAAGIIYLTPNAPLNSGTSIYKVKDNVLVPSICGQTKYDFNTNEIPVSQARERREEEKNQYVETINVSNIYNRIISFDATEFHCAQNYFGDTDENSRLMLVFFVRRLNAKAFPLSRTISQLV